MSCLAVLIPLFCPMEDAVLELQTVEQKAFLTNPARKFPHKADLVPRTVDLSLPRPQIFRWDSTEKAILQIAFDREFKEMILEIPAKVEAQVYNLPVGRKCYWRVRVKDDFSEIRSFTTSPQLPRLIYLPDVTNVRDIGGWTTADGRKIRQGMIYRGAQLYKERLDLSSQELTAEGSHILLQQLKIRTELDLRGEEPCSLHPNLRVECVPMSAYGPAVWSGIFSDEQKTKIRHIFQMMTDPAFYPVYIHCAGGGDRTGTLCFLIGAALGMKEEDLITDYEYSNLSTSGERSRFSEVWTDFMKQLQNYPGSTIQERVVSFLTDCGISAQDLEKLKSLLLEP